MFYPWRLLGCLAFLLSAALLPAPSQALDARKTGLSAPSELSIDPRARLGDQGSNHDGVAVIIGNRRYAHGLPEVRYAENDALAARRLVLDVLGYRVGNVIDLRNASQAEMLSVFGNAADHRGKLWSWVKPGVSDVFVYYSGHGVPGLRDKRGYLLPVDADPATPEINGYSLDLLLSNLSRLEARSTLVLLDACFSGNSAAGWLLSAASPVYIRTEAPPDPGGMSVIAAALGDQVASWDDERRLGLFTRHVMDALVDGAADGGRGGNGDGAITLGELQAYLDDEMTYAARRLHRRVQQVSVIGDPTSVLVPEQRHRAVAAPVAVPPGPSAPPLVALPSSEGQYPAFGLTVDEAQDFLQTHWEEVRRTVVAYYAREGSVWDQRGNPPQVEFAEEMESISERRVVKVDGNTFDMEIRYRWRGGGTTDTAAAVMRIAVAPDALTVEKMWR